MTGHIQADTPLMYFLNDPQSIYSILIKITQTLRKNAVRKFQMGLLVSKNFAISVL